MVWNFLEYQIETLKEHLNRLQSEPCLSGAQASTIYGEALLHYLTANNAGLEKCVVQLKKTESAPLLLALSETRLKIRIHSVQAADIEALQNVSRHPEKALEAERFFVLGLTYELTKNFEKMSDSFEKAYQLFKQCHLNHKALKSLHNSISARSNLEPSPQFLNDYQLFYRTALAANDTEMAGLAVYNISVHYFKLNAYHSSLKNILLAEQHMQNLSFNRSKYLISLQICRIHAALKKIDAVQDHLEHCLLSPFQDIKAAAQSLLELQLQSADLPTSWQSEINISTKLTKKESELLDLLFTQPYEKYKLCDLIFGRQIDPESAANRLNNLMTRVRKKTGLKIIFDQNVFTVSFAELKMKRVNS